MQPVVIDRAAFNQGENAQYEPHIEESEVMDSLVARGPHAVGVPNPIVMRESGQGFWMEDEKAGTLRAEGENRPSRPSHVIGQPVPFRKAKRAQSTTDDETLVEGDVSNTLNNFDLGDTRTTHAVVEPIDPKIVQASELRLRGQITEKDICPTLTAGAKQGDTDPLALVQHTMPGSVAPTVTSSGPPYSRTGNERVEAEALAISFQPGNLARKAGADPSTTTFPTIKCDAGDQSPHVAYPPMAVRRLTPVECERLQGFPDNWSRIPWKGKPEEECPDGPRYKACGNSMAVPVMRWIGERIAQADQTFFPR
jgi:site-specific DNA-cytosine methylase